eukprot:TRINITY_DN86000_c0_g1_i1.p1 TRINITY_DN86000_c0_g1~~TRINITY_DN86000_c0_g1_i1.p1  ORF type:complete len:110 (+),score=8.21 TRINITY_DN86000_c0_g1_i1:46-375(+)
MRSITQKHLSVRDGQARFTQVTVASLADERERIQTPRLFLNDRHIAHPTKEEQALVDAAVTAVREEEDRLRWRGIPLCVTQVESSYDDAHPEAARLAAFSAVAALIEKP